MEELRKYLTELPDEELFDYFKHDGALDFQKKIAAGQILHERGYDKTVLNEEKRKIVADIQAVIAQYDNPETVVNRNKKKLRWNLYYIIGLYILLVLSTVLRGRHNGAPFDWLNFGILTGLVALILIVRAFKYNSALAKSIQKDYDDLELQRTRMGLIEEAWSFE